MLHSWLWHNSDASNRVWSAIVNDLVYIVLLAVHGSAYLNVYQVVRFSWDLDLIFVSFVLSGMTFYISTILCQCCLLWLITCPTWITCSGLLAFVNPLDVLLFRCLKIVIYSYFQHSTLEFVMICSCRLLLSSLGVWVSNVMDHCVVQTKIFADLFMLCIVKSWQKKKKSCVRWFVNLFFSNLLHAEQQ